MAHTLQRQRSDFLATIPSRHHKRIGIDTAYERMMYQARSPPTPRSISHLVEYLRHERPEAHGATTPDDETCRRLAPILAGMTWPDPEPLVAVGRLLPGWDTLGITTLLHSAIPDYAIFGARESHGLERLGLDAPYHAAPVDAHASYRAYLGHIKALRDAVRFDQAPESHHYLTRIVQAALEELGIDHD